MSKEKLNTKFWPIIVLGLVCLISTALLALTSELTAQARADRKAEAVLASKQKVFPQAQSFETMEIPAAYQANVLSAEKAYDADRQILGYLLLGEAAGYGGPVTIYLGITPEGEITGIDVPSNEETPGLGQKIGDRHFSDQFLGLPANQTLVIASGDHAIDAIAGATVSSKAAVSAVNGAIQYFCEQILQESPIDAASSATEEVPAEPTNQADTSETGASNKAAN